MSAKVILAWEHAQAHELISARSMPPMIYCKHTSRKSPERCLGLISLWKVQQANHNCTHNRPKVVVPIRSYRRCTTTSLLQSLYPIILKEFSERDGSSLRCLSTRGLHEAKDHANAVLKPKGLLAATASERAEG